MSRSACHISGCPKYGTVYFTSEYYCDEHFPKRITSAPGGCMTCGRQDGSHEFVCRNAPHSCYGCGRKQCGCMVITVPQLCDASFFFFPLPGLPIVIPTSFL